MNRQRLELAIEVLKEIAAGTWKPSERMPVEYDEGHVKFDLSTWFGFGNSTCGYAACAVGHMCLDHRFIARGLSMVRGNWRPTLWLTKPSEEDPDPDNPDGWDAVELFFEINRVQAFYLFNENYYEGKAQPTDVIERIRQLLTDPESAYK